MLNPPWTHDEPIWCLTHKIGENWLSLDKVELIYQPELPKGTVSPSGEHYHLSRGQFFGTSAEWLVY